VTFGRGRKVAAQDWPEWRGKGRQGVWNESGIVTKFPLDGLKFVWRTAIRSGFSGPAVSAGRVFALDFSRETGLKGTERVLCLDEDTVRVLWTRSWPADYRGMLKLERDGSRARVLWKGKSSSEIDSDGLHALITTPVIDGDFIYGVCSYGQFRCIDARSGARIWQTLEVTGEKARWATAMLVRNGDRYFINNDRGELIIARLIPSGYHEISRTHLIKHTSRPGNRRQAGAVNWSHPAYANHRIYARNDEEIVAASLAK